MSETKFTPGPWRTARGDSACFISSAVAGSIAQTTSKPYWEKVDATDEANAHLIAAAPDLYEALETLIKRTPFQPAVGGITLLLSFNQMDELRTLLTKARGEST